MAVYARIKRSKKVTDPLDEDAKARLCGADHRRGYQINGYATSGSEHEALASLAHDFFFENDDNAAPSFDDEKCEYSDDGEDTGSRRKEPLAAVEAVRDLVRAWCEADDYPFRRRLLSDVTEAAESLVALRSNPSTFRRAVMARLRELGGYNAGVCKAKWEKSGGLSSGSYEYIDVVDATEEGQRYIVDLGFAAEFEVARPTAEYEGVLSALPAVLVGQPEEVKRVVRIAAEAARRSLKARGLHVPPWRKGRYMTARWLGPYRRTVNAVPAAAGAVATVAGGGGGAKCRTIGFMEAAAAGAGWPATLIR